MTDHEKRALIDRYIRAYNAFDVDGMMATVHPEIEFTNVFDGKVNASATGATVFRKLAEQARDLFEERRQTVRALHVHGDRATAEITYEAVLAVDFPNGMRAGHVLKLKGRTEFEFRDGLLSRITDYS